MEGKFLAGAMHNNAMLVWLAAKSPMERSLAFGFLTHNETWGADYTAHIKAPGFPDGYVVEKGVQLVPMLLPVLHQILLNATAPGPEPGSVIHPISEPYATGIAQQLAPIFGHDLSETAIDLLVKRNIDRTIGTRMVLAAKCRPANTGRLIRRQAFALSGAAGCPALGGGRNISSTSFGMGRHSACRRNQTIALLSEQTAPIASMFITLCS